MVIPQSLKKLACSFYSAAAPYSPNQQHLKLPETGILASLEDDEVQTLSNDSLTSSLKTGDTCRTLAPPSYLSSRFYASKCRLLNWIDEQKYK